MPTRPFVLALVPLALAAGCTRGCAPGGGPPGGPSGGGEQPPPGAVVALQVGPHAFSPEDMEVRRGHILFKYPEAQMPEVGAISQVVLGYLYVCVLEGLGRPITEEVLDAEVARINKDTRDPEGLMRLKELAGGEKTRAYRRLVVLPDFANRRYNFEVFPTLDEVHGERRGRTEALLASLLARGTGVSFEEVARSEAGVDHAEQVFSPALGFRIERDLGEESRRRPDEVPLETGDELNRRIEDRVFAPHLPGVIHPEVVAMERHFCIYRWTGWHDEAKGIRRVERLAIAMRDAEEVLFERARAIPIYIASDALRSGFQDRVGWAQDLHLVARP